MSQIPSGWLIIRGVFHTALKKQQVNDGPDGIPVTGPNLFLPKGHQIVGKSMEVFHDGQ